MAATSPTLPKALTIALTFLIREIHQDSNPKHAGRHLESILRAETYRQLQILRQLLTQRSATPNLPPRVSDAIDKILRHQLDNRILTSVNDIQPRFRIPRTLNEGHTNPRDPIRISLWRGDITALSHITAVVNAANSELLGCFQPTHKCIDNVLHSAAGPRLREEMSRIMDAQGHAEPVGHAKVTPGFNLPAQYIIHTVGPSLDQKRGGAKVRPSEDEKKQLASCYRACLDAVQDLPLDSDGRLSIAFCCISTGLFAFPKDVATGIAVHTVIEWCKTNPDTPVTDIVFDVFTEEDLELYAREFDVIDAPTQTPGPLNTSIPKSLDHPTPEPPPSLTHAKQWLRDADYLIISAGAGLSAADGLDYTSQTLFSQHYPTLVKHGLRCLYDTIGFSSWPSEGVKWGYYYTHANLVRNWPKSELYNSVLSLATEFEKRGGYFVRTTNADGLFAANSFPESRIATPQGQYRYLQCPVTCRPDSVFPFADFLDKALPFVDPKTQILTDVSLVPRCKFCGTELTLCVRGGSYFNEAPFEKQEEAWYDFIDQIETSEENKTAVILELGVGLNTAGVLRWPNESLAESGNGKFKLVRVGLGPSASLPFELIEEGTAAVIDGEIRSAVKLLTE